MEIFMEATDPMDKIGTYLQRNELQKTINETGLGDHYSEKANSHFQKFAGQEHKYTHFETEFNNFELPDFNHASMLLFHFLSFSPSAFA